MKAYFLLYKTGPGDDGEPWTEIIGTRQEAQDLENAGATVIIDGEVTPDTQGPHNYGGDCDGW